MSVIFIGDRAVGKTNFVYHLCSQQVDRVKVANRTQADFTLDHQGNIEPTQALDVAPLSLQIRLIAPRRVEVNWLDTPGEMWKKDWQQNRSSDWQEIVQNAAQSIGIVVLLPPYRGLGIHDQQIITDHAIPSTQQWIKRFDDRWLPFFLEKCPKARHIALCIHKADLFLNPAQLRTEAQKIIYDPTPRGIDWVDRNRYLKDKYFSPLQGQIRELDKAIYGLTVRCFITSTQVRSLLELPWLYLGAYL
jgi:hypothetical protein